METPTDTRQRPSQLQSRPSGTLQQYALQLRSKKRKEIIDYLRANLRYDKFEITSSCKFLRFGKMLREITNLLRHWKVVHAVKFDKIEGKFFDTILLYVKEGRMIPKILKVIRKHWIRAEGRYVRRDSEAGEKYLRDFRVSFLKDANIMLDNLVKDRPTCIQTILDDGNAPETNSDGPRSASDAPTAPSDGGSKAKSAAFPLFLESPLRLCYET